RLTGWERGSFWDGKNLDSKDQKSHVAFPVGRAFQDTVERPETHPAKLHRLFRQAGYAFGRAATPPIGSWMSRRGVVPRARDAGV
ncbi:DUF1996 domain-containing protein, partial [Candidatus Bathyarchaeota archaeon]|nr:DUF1996 domain-containing protein [Candidatus Bathyarchaeota archaeon]